MGREEDLPNPGDYLACTIGEDPIFVIRQADGTLEALHNVCPHRGMRLLNGQGNCRIIRCPYHGWTFDGKGQLLEVTYPQLFAGLDKSAIQLLKGRVETWGGFIFVCPKQEGELFRDFLAGVPDYLKQSNLCWKELREVAHWSYDEPVNWKLLIENYLDLYHVPWLHSQTLVKEGMDIQNHFNATLTGRHCNFQFSSKDQLAEKNRYESYVFPNLSMSASSNSAEVWRFKPLSPERTVLEIFLYQTPAQQESSSSNFIETHRSNYDQFMEEDFVVCCLIQETVKSLAYKVNQPDNKWGHAIAKCQQAIADFHKNWLSATKG